MEGVNAQSYGSAQLKDGADGVALLEKLVNTARPESVFSPPVTAGDQVLITAIESTMGLGFGVGRGGDDKGGGSGVGGGGGGMSRPVAAIRLSPEGIHVEPIVDVTKLGIAFFTALGAMFVAWRSMRRAAR